MDGLKPVCFGCHLSLGRKPRASLEEAYRHGARCVQIFASSPGAWKPPVDRPAERAEISGIRSELELEPLVLHAIYLINLASTDQTLVDRSRRSLVATLDAADRLGAATVITHIGSHGGRGFDAVRDQIAFELVQILAHSSGTAQLALENSAGSGGIVGAPLTELEALLCAAGHPPRLRVALDTAHLCGSGWDFATSGTANRLVDEIDGTIGLPRLAVLHANDSKVPPGSRRDRHETAGDGHIGLSGFRSLLEQPRLRDVPWILETPDLGEPADSPQRFSSLRTLRRLDGEILGVGIALDGNV